MKNELIKDLKYQLVDFPPLHFKAACNEAGGDWFVEIGRPAGSRQCYVTVETRSVYDLLTEGSGFFD